MSTLTHYNRLVQQIEQGELSPIYLLYGQEYFFIYKLIEVLEKHVLPQEGSQLNHLTFYGQDADLRDILTETQKYPIGGSRKLVIVKEGQALSRQMSLLETYDQSLNAHSVLVIAYNQPIKSNPRWLKHLQAIGTAFESKPLYENQIGAFVNHLSSVYKKKLAPRASALMAERVGFDLNKINNVFGQMMIEGVDEVDEAWMVEKVGHTHKYSVFDLQNALIKNERKQAFAIVSQLGKDPKNSPLSALVSFLYQFFMKVLLYHHSTNKSPKNLSSVLGVHPYFLRDYQQASTLYPVRSCVYAVEQLKEMDMQAKGFYGSADTSADVLRIFLTSIFSFGTR